MGKKVQARGNYHSVYDVVAEWTSKKGTLYYWVAPEGEDHIYTDFASGYEAYNPKPVKGQEWEGKMFQSPVTIEGVTDEYVVFKRYNADCPSVAETEEFTDTFQPVNQEG